MPMSVKRVDTMRFNRGQLRRRRPAYVPFVGSLESRVVLTINTLVLEFAQAHLGEQVGSGQCTDLANEALRVAGADFAVHDPGNGDYIWGTLITTITPGDDSNPTVPCVPGDIIQYQNVTLADGSTAAHHTSIVAAVDANGRPTYVYEQNVGGNLNDVYDSAVINAQTVEQGTIQIYQPVPRVDSPGEVQFTVTNDTSNSQTVTLYDNGTAEDYDSLTAYQTLGSYNYMEVSSNPPATWTIGVGGQQIALNNAAGYEVDATSNGPAIRAVITSPVITWADPSAIVFGAPLSATQLDATGNVPGTFSYSPPLGAVLQAGNDQTLSVNFTPTDTTDYSSATDTVYIDVENSNRSVPTITWANPGEITYGTPLSSSQLDATASVSGTFSYSPALDTILDAGNDQTLSDTFTPTDTVDYAPGSESVLISVAQAQASLSFGNLSFTYDGLPQSTSITTSPIGLAGVSVTYTDNGLAVASPTAVGSYQITASLDNPDYTAPSITGALTITQPTTTPTQAVVIGEQPLFQRMLNKKGKPTGKAVLTGFTLNFGVALNAVAAETAANYQLDTVTTKKVKKKVETTLHPVANIVVSYIAASDAVQLTFRSKQAFPMGGRITVLPGITTASGATLTGPAVFTIANGGTRVVPT
jgi:hypothetical protein